MKRSLRWTALAAVAVMACSDSLSPRDFDGVWGAEGARLTLSLTVAQFESSCWTGELTMPLIVDGEEFTALSTLNHQGGAGQPESRIVTFRGRMTGDVLALTVEPASMGLGPYTMHKGQQVTIPGCP